MWVQDVSNLQQIVFAVNRSVVLLYRNDQPGYEIGHRREPALPAEALGIGAK